VLDADKGICSEAGGVLVGLKESSMNSNDLATMTLDASMQRSEPIINPGPKAKLFAVNPLTAATVVGFVSVIWFMLLSGWWGVTPGSVITKRQNVLFNSDMNLWVDRMIGNARSPERLVHPLEVPLWRGPCRALQHLLGIFLPSEYAGLFAARLLVAVMAGLGVGFMAFLALHNGLKTTQFILLFIMYLLFTSNSTTALPEHFGISNGLLSISFVLPIVIASAEVRALVLGALVVLCGGTTVTNVLFPLASFVQYCLKSVRTKIHAATAALAVGLGAGVFLYVKSWSIHHFVGKYLSLRLVHHPLKAGLYTLYALVAPAVGPTPRILRVPGWDMVCYEPAYEPLRLSYYFGIQAIGAIAWAILLFTCISKGLREERTRAYMWLPLGWLLFNAAFHNIWGDELFLYAPHWSWALMGVVILGASDLSRRFIAAMVVPVVVSQIYTLFAIKQALQTIVR
jgi:hypothetical protein